MVDFNYIIPTGVIVPDTSELRSQVESEWRSALGQDLPVTSETPQGAMITMEVESRDAAVRFAAENANQINPDIAGGIFLDGLWALTGGSRRGATRSLLTGVLLSGSPNTIVPAGSIATVQVSGEQFALVNTVVIGPSGSVFGTFQAVETGPIAVLPGRLTEVASSVLGWEQVFNADAATVGKLQESDVASRRRRRQTLGLQSSGTPEAVISRLYDLADVRSLSFRENVKKFDQTIDGIFMLANSIYVCVEGGADLDVATALLASKSTGSDWNGGLGIEILEPSSGQPYQVKFDRPVERTFFARFTIKSTPLDASTIIPGAIASYTQGELSVDMGLVVGSDISPFELASAVNEVEPRIFVLKVEISENGTTWSTAVTEIAINEVARLPATAVQVVIA